MLLTDRIIQRMKEMKIKGLDASHLILGPNAWFQLKAECEDQANVKDAATNIEKATFRGLDVVVHENSDVGYQLGFKPKECLKLLGAL